jgi:hypothetical protein
MKYLVLLTIVTGCVLAWLEGRPNPMTYAGERLADQTVIVIIMLVIVVLECLICLVMR